MRLKSVEFLFNTFNLKHDCSHVQIIIVDTHIHLWNVKTAKREWLNGKEMEVLCRTYDINGYYSLLNNQTSAPFLHLRAGIFMETDVVDQDIGTEISEITAVCKNPYVCCQTYIFDLNPTALACITFTDLKEQQSERNDCEVGPEYPIKRLRAETKRIEEEPIHCWAS